jgi:hypothetical protein
MTNGDWLRTLTDKQLASCLAIVDNRDFACDCYKWEEWLKEEYKNNEIMAER